MAGMLIESGPQQAGAAPVLAATPARALKVEGHWRPAPRPTLSDLRGNTSDVAQSSRHTK
eukprot:1486421-Pyramimonas_sp.AAC.1